MSTLKKLILPGVLLMLLTSFQLETGNNVTATRKIRVLIVDGQNNHGAWPKTTVMMKKYLESTGMFTVDVDRTIYTWQGPHNDGDPGMSKEKREKLLQQFPAGVTKKTIPVDEPRPDSTFLPRFQKYDVVLSNFGWKASSWPVKTQKALERFVAGGGGLLIIHAADNSFPEWLEYNKMIGIGGWGGRTEKDGPYVYFDRQNELVRDTVRGTAGSHGAQQQLLITLRDFAHPITKGMPMHWLHAQDELYDRLRGPAENMAVLATAFSNPRNKGTGRHEPMMMTINYGKGRVFHTPMGHTDYSMECVGFVTMLQRAAEWVATGHVTQPLPADFPGPDKVNTRSFE